MMHHTNVMDCVSPEYPEYIKLTSVFLLCESLISCVWMLLKVSSRHADTWTEAVVTSVCSPLMEGSTALAGESVCCWMTTDVCVSHEDCQINSFLNVLELIQHFQKINTRYFKGVLGYSSLGQGYFYMW